MKPKPRRLKTVKPSGICMIRDQISKQMFLEVFLSFWRNPVCLAHDPFVVAVIYNSQSLYQIKNCDEMKTILHTEEDTVRQKYT
jgi:hypothetical protein